VDAVLERRLWEEWYASFDAGDYEACLERAEERHDALFESEEFYLLGSLRPGEPVDADMGTGHGDGDMDPAAYVYRFGSALRCAPPLASSAGSSNRASIASVWWRWLSYSATHINSVWTSSGSAPVGSGPSTTSPVW